MWRQKPSARLALAAKATSMPCGRLRICRMDRECAIIGSNNANAERNLIRWDLNTGEIMPPAALKGMRVPCLLSISALTASIWRRQAARAKSACGIWRRATEVRTLEGYTRCTGIAFQPKLRACDRRGRGINTQRVGCWRQGICWNKSRRRGRARSRLFAGRQYVRGSACSIRRSRCGTLTHLHRCKLSSGIPASP